MDERRSRAGRRFKPKRYEDPPDPIKVDIIKSIRSNADVILKNDYGNGASENNIQNSSIKYNDELLFNKMKTYSTGLKKIKELNIINGESGNKTNAKKSASGRGNKEYNETSGKKDKKTNIVIVRESSIVKGDKDESSIEFYGKSKCDVINNTLPPEKNSLDHLKKELLLLKTDVRIKACIKENDANCKDCILALDEINQEIIMPTMIKKHPQFVDTLRMLSHYVGNKEKLNLGPEEEAEFDKDVERIQFKAKMILSKIKYFFIHFAGQEYFNCLKDKLNPSISAVDDMLVNEILSLTHQQ